MKKPPLVGSSLYANPTFSSSGALGPVLNSNMKSKLLSGITS
eukprot:CAMPEP_0203663684 /NCGR_PEP_ID=MMETSP0090-20130426/1235_1 /ASSEMBLY_ACC=CAM_ASM_001088 /TAXON_ID=426623 /ORGANISM="Chaetoceros affinis, Strain CCMP159" /LENGTH=41 /DNA_ID= /DNA_START= /DNA_END= /DNA_ORIENTATION=